MNLISNKMLDFNDKYSVCVQYMYSAYCVYYVYQASYVYCIWCVYFCVYFGVYFCVYLCTLCTLCIMSIMHIARMRCSLGNIPALTDDNRSTGAV